MKFPKEEAGRDGSMDVGEEGKTVVVGMKMDAGSRELLTWALVKVANAGDRVIALHVLPAAAEVWDSDGKPSSLISLVKAFDAVLGVYEGFCNLKQIDLKLKISRGSSIRKILVQESSYVSASYLILGVPKISHVIGYSSTSVAKYCVKKLSRGCLVVAVSNGKIIFQKEATGNKTTHDFLKKIDPLKLNQVHEELRKADCSNKNSPSLDTSGKRDQPSSETEKENSLAIVPVVEQETPFGCVSVLIRELPEGRPGWPLLRRAIINKKNISSRERPKACVVQWALRLPSRNSASSVVHPDSKQAKSYAIVRSNHASEVLNQEKELPKELLSLQEKYSSVCRLFSYEELMKATSNFSPDNIIGKGGSSKVYKGCLSDGKELAIKILKPSEDVMRDFISEIEIITNLHHKNVISLFGFCFENKNLVLVYDFLSRGSLEDNLHGCKADKMDISWANRYKIAVGVAEALEYLHVGSKTQTLIHRDVKSSNILLSDDVEPQLSDFGLAKWASSATQNRENTACSDLAGTFGYLAPEYFMYGKIDEKIDVYAFGVVLLELLSGRKPVFNNCLKGEQSLVMWAKPILQSGKLDELVDPLLGDNYNKNEMERMSLAASLCVRHAPQARPCISLILKLLLGDVEAVEWARSDSSASLPSDGLDDDSGLDNSNIQSLINLAFLDVEDDVLSTSSNDHSVGFVMPNTSLEDYLKARWSRSSSFD
ncbi:Receptor-like cytosolic serine/threonine-protein kinase RBK1 [Apostasia shenzhenica]|uniref:Receptor-like cytosolic serine/threonine-protein kinase RBK1 n=1 Tax=Apostasia shenzhenica TaxID=1088818 RepID=A0A2H9ZUJ0_9ASPA|nr:Receptor-like cytosolic serine/threonine-protein kinase RBK1 [Apostasia shenzhenica]